MDLIIITFSTATSTSCTYINSSRRGHWLQALTSKDIFCLRKRYRRGLNLAKLESDINQTEYSSSDLSYNKHWQSSLKRLKLFKFVTFALHIEIISGTLPREWPPFGSWFGNRQGYRLGLRYLISYLIVPTSQRTTTECVSSLSDSFFITGTLLFPAHSTDRST